MKTTNIVVVGAGRIGRMHAEIFSRTPGARVVGIVDRHRRRDWLAERGLSEAAVFPRRRRRWKQRGRRRR